MRWFILLFLPLYVAKAEAGLSYLGLCAKEWNCKGTIASYNRVEQINIGWLENTFARDCRCAKQILNQDKPVTLRVHLTNSPCLRKNRCGSYEVFAGETVASASKKIARRNRRLLTKYRAVVKRFKRGSTMQKPRLLVTLVRVWSVICQQKLDAFFLLLQLVYFLGVLLSIAYIAVDA